MFSKDRPAKEGADQVDQVDLAFMMDKTERMVSSFLAVWSLSYDVQDILRKAKKLKFLHAQDIENTLRAKKVTSSGLLRKPFPKTPLLAKDVFPAPPEESDLRNRHKKWYGREDLADITLPSLVSPDS